MTDELQVPQFTPEQRLAMRDHPEAVVRKITRRKRPHPRAVELVRGIGKALAGEPLEARVGLSPDLKLFLFRPKEEKRA